MNRLVRAPLALDFAHRNAAEPFKVALDAASATERS
jgi:hypothetical protein